MAITRMRHIKGSGGSNGLKRSIAYIMNPDKTEDGLLIGGNAGTTQEEVFDVMMETKREWDKTLGAGYTREDITFRIMHREMEKDKNPSVIEPRAKSVMEGRLAPYLRIRLSPYQLVFVRRIGRIGHYLEAKNPSKGGI